MIEILYRVKTPAQKNKKRNIWKTERYEAFFDLKLSRKTIFTFWKETTVPKAPARIPGVDAICAGVELVASPRPCSSPSFVPLQNNSNNNNNKPKTNKQTNNTFKIQ